MHITFYSQPTARSTTSRKPSETSSQIRAIGYQTGLFVILLLCSLSIYLFGANYYKLFPTNGNPLFAGGIAGFFLAAAFVLKRSKYLAKYSGIAYAFFIASTVNLVSDLLAGHYTDLVELFGLALDPNGTQALSKLYDSLLVITPILLLTVASRADLAFLYLKIGNQYRQWGFGIGALILINLFTSVLIFFGTGYSLPKLGSAVAWGLVFALSNSILEELWVRGLFLRKLLPVIGAAGTVLLTSIAFASLHFLSVAYLPISVVPIFVANTFTLGVACSILMLKTDSIWGAFLIHAAADLFLFIATLAAH